MSLIDGFLSRNEDKTLEFKRDLSSPKPLLKTLVAFANTAGGSVVIGMDDDKKFIGVDDPLSIEEKLTSLIADHICPFLLPTIKIISHKKKSLILVEVPFLANMGPFYFKQLGPEKGVMVRLGSSTRAASKEVIQELHRIRYAQGFDALPCPQASYGDLDKTLLAQVFSDSEIRVTKSTLKTLKVLVPYGDDVVPSNAGVILFGKEHVREQLFPNAYVSCARFVGTDKVDFLDRLDIGSIIEAVNAVPAFIRRNTRFGAVIDDIKRMDIPEYPIVALREGLLNALMHADYSHTAMRIFVSIFDDRLEIRNPGSLLPGMTVESIKEGVSMPRNFVIARIFQILGWVEQFGTGYMRISKACSRHSYPLPEWRELSGPYTDIIFKPLDLLPIHSNKSRPSRDQAGTKSGPSRDQVGTKPAPSRDQVGTKLGPSRDQVGTKSGPSRDQVGTKSGPSRDQVGTKLELGQEEALILRLCSEPKAVGELMEELGWKNRTKFRRRFLMPLIERGLLTMTIPEKPNSPLQKYVAINIHC